VPWNYTDAIEALLVQRDFLQDVGLATFMKLRYTTPATLPMLLVSVLMELLDLGSTGLKN